jgi:hypothetical protein
MNKYIGVIVEESLSDNHVLAGLKILSTEVEAVTAQHATPWLERWTMDTVEIPESEIDSVAERVSKSFDSSHATSWYADFMSDRWHYVVFPGRVFRLDRGKATDYEAMAEYAASIGIPEHQVPKFEYGGVDRQAFGTNDSAQTE